MALYCNNCGQCHFISNDDFVEHYSISGTETRYLDCITGETNDYGDSNTEGDGGDSEYECPNCSSSDIEWDWDGTEEEALNQRKEHEDEKKRSREEWEREQLKEQIKESEWDLSHNI